MGDIDIPKNGHLALFAYHMWGHQRGLCALVAKAVHTREIHVTHLAPSTLVPKINEELAKYFVSGEEHLRALIRVVGLACDPSPYIVAPVDEAFEKTYKLLAEGVPVPKSFDSEETYEALPPPSLAIIDALAWNPFNVVRSLSPSTKVFVWNCGALIMTYVAATPRERGGLFGDLDEQMKEVDKLGLSKEQFVETVKKLWIGRSVQGKVVSLPGLPEIFDYECFPQNSPNMGSIGMIRYIYKINNESDGFIVQTSPYLEGQIIDAWKDWYGDRPVFAVAPLVPPAHITEAETEVARQTSEVFRGAEKFLDAALEKYGENSVVYISFGSEHWTTTPEMFWAFLEVLLELKVPFLFSHASPLAQIPEDFNKKLESTDLAFHSKWLPQQMILDHKATGWFVTHCGQNGVVESLGAGVPCICWPLNTDQPFIAARLTKLDVAYELFEVRNSLLGLRPSYRLGGRAPKGTVESVKEEAILVLGQAFGPDGRLKRKNAQKISEQLGKSWDEGGHCYNEIRRLASLV